MKQLNITQTKNLKIASYIEEVQQTVPTSQQRPLRAEYWKMVDLELLTTC
jgi:hypothetical protein